MARSESEVSLGGSDLIDAKRLEDFDYAALGHIHRPQITGKDILCFSGSPLKYSQSEIPYHKSVVVAQLGQKGHLMIRRQSLPVLRDMRMIEGNFDQILKSNPNEKESRDLVFFSLLDRVLVPNAMNRLRTIYPNALGIFMGRRNENGDLSVPSQKAAKPADVLFEEFYQSITGEKPQEQQNTIIRNICDRLRTGGDANETDPTGI